MAMRIQSKQHVHVVQHQLILEKHCCSVATASVWTRSACHHSGLLGCEAGALTQYTISIWQYSFATHSDPDIMSFTCMPACLPAVACCSPDERQGSFLKEWLDSHLAAAETINKPLLFEEFGKKLSPTADPDTITKLRDPVYEASYQAVEAAVESDRPLLGSLYWKWAVPGLEKGEGGAGGERRSVR